MAEPRVALIFAFRVTSGLFLSVISAAAGFVPTVQAQAQQTQSLPVAGVVVIGEGSVSVTPDYAQIGSGVITRANTVKEATDANSKLMSMRASAASAAAVPIATGEDTLRVRITVGFEIPH